MHHYRNNGLALPCSEVFVQIVRRGSGWLPIGNHAGERDPNITVLKGVQFGIHAGLHLSVSAHFDSADSVRVRQWLW